MLSRRFALSTSTRRALLSANGAPFRAATHAVFSSSAQVSKPASIIFQSPHESLDIPKTTIWEIAQQQAATNGKRNAFIDGVTHQKLTFEELYEGAKRLAVALAEDGVRKGDVNILSDY